MCVCVGTGSLVCRFLTFSGTKADSKSCICICYKTLMLLFALLHNGIVTTLYGACISDALLNFFLVLLYVCYVWGVHVKATYFHLSLVPKLFLYLQPCSKEWEDNTMISRETVGGHTICPLTVFLLLR